MLDRVLTYVRGVVAGEIKGDPAVGRYLMDALGANTEDLEKNGFNASLQVCFKKSRGSIPRLMGGWDPQDALMISYLANLVRSQVEVSSRLALLPAS